jgi:hypothetical protein
MRKHQQIVFTFAAAATLSNSNNLSGGAFGTLIVPAALAGKSLQFVNDLTSHAEYAAGIDAGNVAGLNGKDLLTTPITLVSGANPLTSEMLTQVGASGPVRLKLDVAHEDGQQILLWWKD